MRNSTRYLDLKRRLAALAPKTRERILASVRAKLDREYPPENEATAIEPLQNDSQQQNSKD